MDNQELLERVDQLFAGRRDMYAEGYPKADNKFGYVKVREPLTRELLFRHLKGEVMIGVYPMQSDNTVEWFALDIDAPKADDPGEAGLEYARAVLAAQAQADRFEAQGLKVYLERSRSGTGVHIWGFLQEPLPAALVRRAVMPLVDRVVGLDKRYPNQDELAPDGEKGDSGNLIALPFYGKAVPLGNSVFVTRVGEAIPVREFVQTVERNGRELLERLAAAAPPAPIRPSTYVSVGDPGEYNYGTVKTGALKVLSPYGCSWFRYMWQHRHDPALVAEPEWYKMLQVCTHFEQGRNLAHSLFSDHKYYNARGLDEKYDQALRSPRIGCQHIHEHYPHLACQGCPMKAPHYLADRTLGELIGSKRSAMTRAGGFDRDLVRIRSYDDGSAVSGVPLGVPGVDQHVRLRPGELIGVGARPSMGKTQFMVHSTVATSRAGIRTFAFSAETGEIAYRDRCLGHVARVDTRLLRGERRDQGRRLRMDEWARLEAASDELKRLPLFIEYTSLDPNDVLAQIEAGLLSERAGLHEPFVVWYDYLQYGALLQPGSNEYERVSQASAGFKFVAQITNQPMVTLVQLKRTAEGAEDASLTDFRDSGRIEQDHNTSLIIGGERVEGDKAPRWVKIVKQKDSESNITVPMLLTQLWGEWTYPAADRKPATESIFGSEE